MRIGTTYDTDNLGNPAGTYGLRLGKTKMDIVANGFDLIEQQYVRNNIESVFKIKPTMICCDNRQDVDFPDGINIGVNRLTHGFWVAGSFAEFSNNEAYSFSVVNGKQHTNLAGSIGLMISYRVTDGDSNWRTSNLEGSYYDVNITNTSTTLSDIQNSSWNFLQHDGNDFRSDINEVYYTTIDRLPFPTDMFLKSTNDYGNFNISTSDLTSIIELWFSSDAFDANIRPSSKIAFDGLTDDWTADPDPIEFEAKIFEDSSSSVANDSTDTCLYIKYEGFRMGADGVEE
jgi:hypothetical protein